MLTPLKLLKALSNLLGIDAARFPSVVSAFPKSFVAASFLTSNHILYNSFIFGKGIRTGIFIEAAFDMLTEANRLPGCLDVPYHLELAAAVVLLMTE